MSRQELLQQIEEHEAEIVARLAPLYAEVQHWERELAATRKAKHSVTSSPYAGSQRSRD